MDDYVVDHEMPLHLMKKKNENENENIKKFKRSTKIHILNTLEYKEVFNSVCISSGQVKKNQLRCMFMLFYTQMMYMLVLMLLNYLKFL